MSQEGGDGEAFGECVGAVCMSVHVAIRNDAMPNQLTCCVATDVPLPQVWRGVARHVFDGA